MTATGGAAIGAAGASARPRRGLRPSAVTAVIITATLLAVALRIYDLTRPGYLFGISEYDDGTDFGSATASSVAVMITAVTADGRRRVRSRGAAPTAAAPDAVTRVPLKAALSR